MPVETGIQKSPEVLDSRQKSAGMTDGAAGWSHHYKAIF